MSFCYTVITPAAFPCGLINGGLWFPSWIELGAVYTFGLGWDRLMDIHLWIYCRYYTQAWPRISLLAWEVMTI